MAKRTIEVNIKVDTEDFQAQMQSINQEFWGLWLSGIDLVVGREMDQIKAHYQEDLPNECIGLIWNTGEIQRLRNQADSPVRFSISKAQLAERLAEKDVEDSNCYLMAIYHSHPGGNTLLSKADVRSFRAQHESGLEIPWLTVTETNARLWFMEKENGELTDKIGSFYIGKCPYPLPITTAEMD